MQTIHPQWTRAASSPSGSCRASRAGAAALLGAALALSASAAWAQDPSTQPAPVPGAGQAAAQASQSGSGATTGAGSDPISATTVMRATGTPSTSNGSASQSKKNRKNKNSKTKAGSIPPWEGRRVLLLLPLQLGPGFNADQAFGQLILSRAEAELQSELEATGKFSIIRAYRFSPLIQRALQEKRLTSDEAENVIQGLPPGVDPSTADEPITVEAANKFLSRLTFDRLPLIGQFNLEEVRSSNTGGRVGVQAQVSGRLYEARNQVALKSPVLTSNTVTTGRNNIDRYLEAVRMAFGSVASELVAPLDDIALPQSTTVGSSGMTGSSGMDGSNRPTQPAPDMSMGTGTAPAMGTGSAGAGTAPATGAGAAPPPTNAGPASVPVPIPAPEAGAAAGAVAPGTVAPGTEAPAP